MALTDEDKKERAEGFGKGMAELAEKYGFVEVVSICISESDENGKGTTMIGHQAKHGMRKKLGGLVKIINDVMRKAAADNSLSVAEEDGEEG